MHLRTCKVCGINILSKFKTTDRCDKHKRKRGGQFGKTWKWYEQRKTNEKVE